MRAFTVSTHGTIRKFDTIEEARADVSEYEECFKGLAPRQVFEKFPTEAEYDEYLKKVEEFERAYQEHCAELRGQYAPCLNTEVLSIRAPEACTFEHHVDLGNISQEEQEVIKLELVGA